MYGETLAMGRVEDPERISQFSSIIAKESDRLTSMIDNVLDFSRIEAGKELYAPVLTRLDLHLENVLRSYRPHLVELGFTLNWRTPPPLWAKVDPEGLTQALVNLLGNARKYTPSDGKKQIEVRLEAHGNEGWIDILDRGPGVPEGERQKIFETFYRASTAGPHRGVGLGLALVRHFAEHHGGRVAYEARDGQGSIFRIVLPLVERETATEKP
jgi:signal transduction histidine kinase